MLLLHHVGPETGAVSTAVTLALHIIHLTTAGTSLSPPTATALISTSSAKVSNVDDALWPSKPILMLNKMRTL
jgi:hypothetical protein